MRVLIVGLNYAPEPTGIAPYTAGLAEGLVARGHAVEVITTMPHYPEWRVMSGYQGMTRKEFIGGVSVRRVRHYVPSRPTGGRRLLSELTFGLRAILSSWSTPDVIIAVSPALFASALVLLRSRISRRTTVAWVQDLYSLGLVETRGRAGVGLVSSLTRWIEVRVLRLASGVVVIHSRFAQAVRRLGLSAEDVQVVRNWTHLGPRVGIVREDARRQLNWHDGEIIVLHSGAMGRKQDLDQVIAAARLVDDRNLPVRFVLMGNGSERARLERSARGIGSITFFDPLPLSGFQTALAVADVLLVCEHSGVREMAVPSKLTSYFHSGRPVLAVTDGDSVTAEELALSRAGIRVDPGRPELLIAAAMSLGHDPKWADRLGAAGRDYQRSILSEESALYAFDAWLAVLLTRKASSNMK